MKILKTLFIGMVVLAMATAPAYGARKKDKDNNGKAKGLEKQNQGQNNGQSSKATEKRNNRTERTRNQADVRANRPEKGERGNRFGRDKAKIEHAKWSHNPHDTRGQGNMGKPKMRDPYGFDKDSGREKGDRGRPIREDESLLNLADILSIQFIDPYLSYLYELLARYQDYAERYSEYSFYSWYVTYLTNTINNYTSRYTYDRVAVNRTDTINYNLTLNTPDGFEGTTLLVTTSLISTNDYNYTRYRWTYNPTTGTWQRSAYLEIHYEAGQAIMEQTQEVTLGTDNTVNFSYDPPTTMTYTGLYAELAVTVTEPESGQSYTMNYDRQIWLYRCPYGKVYNAKTRQPVVGAKVCVHFEDGSIVPLDKASNPTAKNPQKTDATGRYGVKLQTNRKYYLTAKAEGYADYKSEVFTEKWHVLREDIALTPLEAIASK